MAKFKRPSQGDFDKAFAQGVSASEELCDNVASGLVSPEEFGSRFGTLLENRHAQAATLGRRRAGDPAAIDAHDRAFAKIVMQKEKVFLDGFAGDVVSGKYADSPDGMKARCKAFLKKMTATAGDSFALASDPASKMTWHLGETENHCSQCPAYAAGSPYPANALPAHPGDGSTDCYTSCRCHLSREDGVECFKTPD